MTDDIYFTLTKLPKPIRYYFIVASDYFLIKEEPLEEVLRERAQHYRRVQKRLDFWLVRAPVFLTTPDFVDLRNSLPSGDIYKCTAIISTDESFVTWLKLRYNNVAIGHFFGPTCWIPNPIGTYCFNKQNVTFERNGTNYYSR